MELNLKNLTLNKVIEEVEDFQDLILETNADRVTDDWLTLGYPTAIAQNNPYRLLHKVTEGVRLGLVTLRFFKHGLGGDQ